MLTYQIAFIDLALFAIFRQRYNSMWKKLLRLLTEQQNCACRHLVCIGSLH